MLNYKVYGLIGVESKLSNWNADFTGNPRSMTNGVIYGTDKALKYAIRNYWDLQGKELFVYKKLHNVKEKLIPMTLSDKYISKYGEIKDSKSLLTNLFSIIDIKQFGVAFALKNWNISINGAVQIGQGLNKLDKNYTIEQEILSPFASSSEKTQSTTGIQIIVEHCCYMYPFVINPLVYNKFMELGVTDGYLEEDFENFKGAALNAVSELNSCSKFGCNNNFVLFIKSDLKKYLPPLDSFINIKESDNGMVITLKIKEVLSGNEKIEIYYNNLQDKLITDIEKYDSYNIITKEVIKKCTA